MVASYTDKILTPQVVLLAVFFSRKEEPMDGFMTLKEASEKWGICERRIRTLCTEERIDGAAKIGHMWVIPSDSLKPADQRIKTGKYIKNKAEE